MTDIYVKYPYDPTGRNSDNLVSGELHTLSPVSGFPYKIITMINGGFFARSVRVYDANYRPLVEGVDYILTYRYAHTTLMLGMEVCNDIVFLDRARIGSVFVSAQMVGGDVAFSLTGIPDYVAWYNAQPVGYVPRMFDFNGNQPEWLPGELDEERWRLDTYQPFNNEMYEISRSIQGGQGIGEDKFRTDVNQKYNEFLTKFNNQLQTHISNLNNPHVDTKDTIGLSLVENYRVATVPESRTGVSNVLYQTPLLTWNTVDAFALVPLNTHIYNRSNPHRTTAATIDAPSKSLVDGTAVSKYTTTETVTNTVYFMADATPVTWTDFYYACRANIPPANFSAGGSYGFLNPNRIGVGQANYDSVLRSGPTPQWVPFAGLLQENNITSPPTCKVLDFGQTVSRDTAFAIAVNDPFAASAPIHSIICYSLWDVNVWGAGNGTYTSRHWVTHVLYKTAGGWVQV